MSAAVTTPFADSSPAERARNKARQLPADVAPAASAGLSAEVRRRVGAAILARAKAGEPLTVAVRVMVLSANRCHHCHDSYVPRQFGQIMCHACKRQCPSKRTKGRRQ